MVTENDLFENKNDIGMEEKVIKKEIVNIMWNNGYCVIPRALFDRLNAESLELAKLKANQRIKERRDKGEPVFIKK